MLIIMSGASSSTGLIAARINPVYRRKSKKIELLSIAQPAPFTLRPFSGLFNPFPYGCSVLCNHPADCEAKGFIRRAKESWAMEGKALLLPEEMDMIRASLLAGTIVDGELNELNNGITINATTTVPEELFRKYTETDSRPLTPTPTLASGTIALHQIAHDIPVPCNPRERTTLILDLRTSSQEQDETLSWHALTLEPPPSPRRTCEYSKTPPLVHRHQQSRQDTHPLVVQVSEENSSRNRDDDEDEDDDKSNSANEMPIKRRGKRLKKRRCRRGSGYGQLNEVRDPLEPLETQVSQVDDETSRRNSALAQQGNAGDIKNLSEKVTSTLQNDVINSSFISADILKHLARELDRDIVEEEFRLKRKIALEEALRIKEETHGNPKSSSRQSILSSTASSNAPRVFSRQSARFELLSSASLSHLKPLEYLENHVFITSGRKLIFGRTFNKFYEENLDGKRFISPNDFFEALQEVMGNTLNNEQLKKLSDFIGDVIMPLNFRTWCGICAACERLLCPLPSRDLDSPAWIEKADFEALERRLQFVHNVDTELVHLLREIRDR